METRIRDVRPADLRAIREINHAAFRAEQPQSFERMLQQGVPGVVARVAVTGDEQVVGHVIFAPARISLAGGDIAGMGLGELAIRPEHQRRGIGTQLTNAALAELDAANCAFCIVVGHATYYPRFGFERGSLHGISCQWPRVPDASFMVRIGVEKLMRGIKGIARFDGIA